MLEFSWSRTIDESSADAWGAYLRERGWFPGATERAGEMLASVSAGIEWVRGRMRVRFGHAIARPALALAWSPDGEAFSTLGYVHGPDQADRARWNVGHVVAVNVHHLAQCCALASRRVVRRDAPDAAVSFRGDCADFYYLGGVEEADHARFREASGRPIPPAPPGLTLAAYDARDAEFESLGARLEAAEERGMAEETRAVLRARFIAAVSRRTTALAAKAASSGG